MAQTRAFADFGMPKIISHIAYLTFILQGILFLLLLPASLYLNWVLLHTKDKVRTKGKTKRAKKEKPNLPALQPLKCASCGAGVPLRETDMKCLNCGAKIAVPPNYANIGKLRHEAILRLRQASRYLRRASVLSSSFLRWAIVFLALWFCALPFIMVGAGEIEPYESALKWLGNWTVTLFFGSWLLWILILFFTAIVFTSKVRKVLPKIEKDKIVGAAETAECSMCGGAIRYEKGDLATVCGYCGVETYRVKVAWEAHQEVNTARQAATFSLIQAAQEFEEKAFDIISTPVIIVFIFVIAPFFMIVLPYLAWNFVKENLLVSVPIIMCLIGIGYLLKRFYWQKS